LSALRAEKAERTTIQWPSPKYRNDILGFTTDILGIKPYKRQRDLLLAIQNNNKVAARAGRKVGKTNTVGIASLWHYSSHEGSKVAITGPGGETVGSVVYDEICRLQNRSGICLQCREAGIQEAPCPHSAIITGDQSPDCRFGIRAKDRRRIYGYATRKAGAARGISGSALFLVADEASEVDDQVFEILSGNAASSGSTKILLTGNPSKITGFFYDAFHRNASLWTTIHISSKESPNITGEFGHRIDGLADADWIAEQEAMYGSTSPQFLVDVLGEFSSLAESRPFTEEVLRDSVDRHATQAATGRLHLGIDVAGPKGTGDSTVLAVRRGLKVLGHRSY
jgi:hypothetical protein